MVSSIVIQYSSSTLFGFYIITHFEWTSSRALRERRSQGECPLRGNVRLFLRMADEQIRTGSTFFGTLIKRLVHRVIIIDGRCG